MTVVMCIVCEDGLVMGSDSQITEKDRGMSYPGQKLHPLGEHGAWGGSGARAVLLDVEKVFDASSAAILEGEDVSREIQERVLPILRHHYDTFITDVPGEELAGTPSTYVLAAGYSHDEPFVVEINPHGMIGRFEGIGFHAVGSGAALAQQAGALLSHIDMSQRSVQHGVAGIVRVIDALCSTSPSVGGPIDVCRITPEGAHHLSDDEIEEAREDVERWTAGEKRVLDRLFS